MILAILLAPLVAVQVQKYLELLREKRERKQWIFNTLMATRASRVSPEHVQALNMIDIAFSGRKMVRRRQNSEEKQITEAWKIYLDHLCRSDINEKNRDAWTEKGSGLFVDLLQKMAQHLGYDFDKVHLDKGVYTPQAQGELELDQLIIRKQFAEILQGKRGFPMEVISFPFDEQAAQKQQEVNEKLSKYLDKTASAEDSESSL